MEKIESMIRKNITTYSLALALLFILIYAVNIRTEVKSYMAQNQNLYNQLRGLDYKYGKLEEQIRLFSENAAFIGEHIPIEGLDKIYERKLRIIAISGKDDHPVARGHLKTILHQLTKNGIKAPVCTDFEHSREWDNIPDIHSVSLINYKNLPKTPAVLVIDDTNKLFQAYSFNTDMALESLQFISTHLIHISDSQSEHN